MKKIGFIGVGKLGLECAEAIASCGYYVEGYDVCPRDTRLVTMVPSIESLVKDKNIIFIAVPTPHDPKYGGETPTSHMAPKDFDYRDRKSVV